MRKLTIEAWDDHSFFVSKTLEVVGSDDFYHEAELCSRSHLDLPTDTHWLAFSYGDLKSNVLSELPAGDFSVRLDRNENHPSNTSNAIMNQNRRAQIPAVIDVALQFLMERFLPRAYESHAKRKGLPSDPLIAQLIGGTE